MYFGNNRWHDGSLTTIVLGIAVGLLLGAIYFFVTAFIGMCVWNYAVVSMFGAPQITFWKMFALMVLVHLFVPLRINYNNN